MNTIPTKIGKYEVHEEIGRGACGVVHRAYDPFIEREVALKIAFSGKPLNEEETIHYQNEFFTEAHAAGKLNHPNIVALYDAGFKSGYRFIVMEYVKGHTLQAHIENDNQALTLEQKIDAIFCCCKALIYAHEYGVVHRDLKPSNIMRTETGETKVMDYSIAKILEGESFTPETIIGSPSYMSPEQILKERIGRKSDMYSLGAVAFHLITGQRPFDGTDVHQVMRDVINHPTPSITYIDASLPTHLSNIIEKAMQKNPDDRFASCHEFAEQLTKAFNILRYQERRIARLENRDTLKGLDFFKDFNDQDIEDIIAKSEFISFTEHDFIVNEGDIDQAFYIIAKGSVNIVKANKAIATLQQGDCFGEVGFLSSYKRTATVIANGNVLVLKINSVSIDSLAVETQLHYYKAFNETLIYRLLMTSAKLSAAE